MEIKTNVPVMNTTITQQKPVLKPTPQIDYTSWGIILVALFLLALLFRRNVKAKIEAFKLFKFEFQTTDSKN